MILYLDFETYSDLDIELVGTDNYARSAHIHMLGWAIDDQKVQVWFPNAEKIPQDLQNVLLNPEVIKIAWHVPFERSILKYQLKTEIPIIQWRDPMILAHSLSLPGKLEKVCDILKIGDAEAKIKDGRRLIRFFCEPNGTKGQETLYGVSNGFNNPKEHEAEWKKFVEYCMRDVEIERKLWKLFQKFSFPEEQWRDWFFDQEMNEIGIPTNVERARKALALADRYKKEAEATLNSMTGLENANSRAQLLPWLIARGYPWGSLLKNYVDTELKNSASKLTPDAKAVLLLRQKSSQNSYKKLEKLLAQVSPDGRLRYQFAFMGAARTGRWSSGGVQVQNPPRPTKAFKNFMKKQGESAIFRLIDTEDYEGIKKEFDGSTLPFVSSCIRMLFEAPADKEMVVCDLSAIEYGTVGWLARCKAIMTCVQEKRDSYLNFATALYPDRHYTYDELKKQYDAGNTEIENVRQQAKPPVLGGGFGLGGGDLIVNEFGDTVRSGLWGYALNVCGVDMSKEEAHAAVKAYRKINFEVVQLWTDLEQAFKHTLKYGKPVTIGHVTWDKKNRDWTLVSDNFTKAFITFHRDELPGVGFVIRMELPSGRFLHYLNCRIEEEEFTYTDKKTGKKKTAIGEVIYYDGVEHSATTDDDGSISKKAHKWGKTKTYGGKLTENAVQAIARDILINGCHLAREMGFEIFGVFHDEIGALVKKVWDSASLEDLRWCMSEPPAWGSTLILDAAGYTSQVYKKG